MMANCFFLGRTSSNCAMCCNFTGNLIFISIGHLAITRKYNPTLLPISDMYINIIFVVGPLAFTIIGSIVAFLSGLIFTLNNFLVKATRADFGEVLAVRCLIQIPLMGTIAILNGMSKTF